MVRPNSTFGTRDTRMHMYKSTGIARSKDYMFFDFQVKNLISLGGSIFNIYRLMGYRGSDGSILPINTITDPVLMENPLGRVYAKEVVPMWAFTKIDRNIFEQMAWGLNVASSEITEVVFHYNSMIEKIGRKFIVGDIIEVGFLRDIDLLDPTSSAANRFFVVSSSQKFRGTYDPHYQMHLWSIEVTPLIDSPEYSQIVGGDTNNSMNSVYDREIDIMDQLLDEANQNVEYEGTDVHQLYMEVDEQTGKPKIYSFIYEAFGNDGVPPNFNPEEVNFGERFPEKPQDGEYFLRINSDERPRLYYFKDGRWNLVEIDQREKWSGIPRLLKPFIENDKQFVNDEGELENHRQTLREVSMSRAIYKPGWK